MLANQSMGVGVLPPLDFAVLVVAMSQVLPHGFEEALKLKLGRKDKLNLYEITDAVCKSNTCQFK